MAASRPMKTLQLLRRSAAFVLLSLLTPRLMAHAVWIEPVAEGVMGLRFAEPDGKVEKSPGRLDAFTLPVAHTLDKAVPAAVEVTRKSDHFLLAGATAAQVICAQTTHAVMGKEGEPGRLPVWYARWQASLELAAAPSLTLDIVPTGKPGEARVYFRGQPLGGVKAMLYTPSADTELTADADGFLRFEAAKAGQYLLTTRHVETLAGFHAGKASAVTSHGASLVWKLEK